MERDWRHAQNTRMDSARSTSICRRFINGSCRLGSRCKYRHEWPVTPSAQICRYFQKGGCWYGEYCRYLHVIQPEVDAAVASRRSSVPTVSSSSVSYVQPDRRGSVPALLQAEVTSRQECSRSESVVNVPNPQHNIEQLAANIAKDQSQGLAQSSEIAQAQVCDGRNEQEMSSSETTDEGAAAAAAAAAAATTITSSTQGKVDKMEAIRQSKNVTCGICMDKVYEKIDPKKHVFGILPNCNHSFCLQCIMTWRKTKDFGLDVVKSCPQCRVRSAFYVPNKYWVEGQAKENVIAAFKEKLSKKSCSYFSRYGGCPFKAECLYRHDNHARNTSYPYPMEDDDDCYDGEDLLNLVIAMTLLGSGGDYDDDDDDDDDEDFNFAFYLAGEYGF